MQKNQFLKNSFLKLEKYFIKLTSRELKIKWELEELFLKRLLCL